MAECLLDAMREAGTLGSELDRSNRRHAAGLWLRRLYQGVMMPRVTMDLSRDGDRGQAEMSDRQAARHSLYCRTIKALGPDWKMIRQVCCEDRRVFSPRLLPALDRLADWRGMA